MSRDLQSDQTYRSNARVPYGPASIRIVSYEPGDTVAYAVDPDTGMHCHVLAVDLHSVRPTGAEQYDGYTLNT
ncbi:hypothetical protein [Streptomyces sp. NPDC059631]|uniref:hypothetical protein n=1 Tax=unclassified Streptomyces TaxID=2593676 RepID=UPI0036AD1B82